MKYAMVIGTYYRILGWMSLAYLLLTFALAFWTLSTYWSDRLSIDLTFFIWLWLGSRLKRGDSTARKCAIGISVFATLFTLVFILTGVGITYLGSYAFAPPDIRYYLVGAGVILLVGLPGLLLLSRKAREEFRPVG